MRQILNILIFILFVSELSGQDIIVSFSTTDSITQKCTPYTGFLQSNSSVAGSNGRYFWTINGYGEFEGENIPLSITDPGYYDVKLIVERNSDGKRDSLEIDSFLLVGAEPEASFEIKTTSSGCIPYNLVLENTSQIGHAPITSFLWDFGNGSISTDSIGKHVYKESINARLKLTITDSLGCTNTAEIQNYFDLSKSHPTIDFDIPNKRGCGALHTISIVDSSTGNGSMQYLWNFGEDSLSIDSVKNPSYTYKDTGNFNISVHLIDSLNCSNKVEYSAFVKIRKLDADFTFSLQDSCSPFGFSFADTSSEFANNWNWKIGSFSSSQINPTYTFSDTGAYTVALTVTDDYNCSTTKDTIISIEQSFYADFNTDTLIGCDTPFVVNFENESFKASKFAWEFDGHIDSSENPSFTFLNNGHFDVKLTVFDSNNCSHTKEIESMVIVENFTSDFDTNRNTYCSPSILYQDNTTPSPVAWKWNFAGLEEVPLQNFSFTFPDTGSYPVTLYTYGKYCSDTITKNIHINNKPTIYADFISDIQTACDTPLNVNFTSTSKGGHIYSWEFGDDGSSGSENPNHVYNQSGYYTVQLTISDTNTDCRDTRTRFEYEKISKPFSSFSTSINCENQKEATFQNTDEFANKWSWNFGDGTLASNDTIKHLFSSENEFIVTLILSDTLTNCSATKRDTINTRKVKASFNSDTTVCYNEEITFTNTSTNFTEFNWDFGDQTNNDSITSPSHIYNSIGYRTIQLNVSNGICTDTLILEDYLNVKGSIANFNYSLNCSDPKLFNFKDSSINASSYLWNFGDEDSSIRRNVLHSYLNEGTYDVLLTTFNEDKSCFDTATAEIVVNTPIANIFSSDSGSNCFGDSIHFEDYSNIAQDWEWNFGDGNTSNSKNPSHFYSDTGTYNIRLIITANGICKDTIEKANYVNIIGPKADFYTIKDCANPNQITFKDSSLNFTSVLWNFGDGNSSTDTLVPHLFNSKGDYFVSLTAFDAISGCSNSKNDTILIRNINANASAFDDTICFSEEGLLMDLSTDAINWTWKVGSDSSINQNPNFKFKKLGYQRISLTAFDTNGCSDTKIFDSLIFVIGPIADFSIDFDCIDYNRMELTNNSSSATDYTWNFGDGIISYDTNVVHHYTTFNEYEVELKAINQNNNCVDIKRETVQIFKPKADFTSNNNLTCEGVNINLEDLSLFPKSWEWTFNEDSVQVFQNPTIAFENKGFYQTKLVYTDINDCKDSLTVDSFIQVNSQPTVEFSADILTGCTPFDVNLTENSFSDTTIVEWIWSIPGQFKYSNQQNPKITIDDNQRGGQFEDITLQVIDLNNCSNTLTKENYLLGTKPISYASIQKDYCINDTLSYEDFSQGIGMTYEWIIDSLDTVFGQQIIYPLNKKGQLDIALIISDTNSCTDTLIKPKHLSIDEPIANFYSNSITSKFCPPLLVSFQDSSESNIQRYEWDFGDNSGIGIGYSAAHNYTDVGSFDVTLTITTPGGCKDSITKENFVNISGPNADLRITSDLGNQCKPLNVCFELINQEGFDSYQINYGDGTMFDDSLCHNYNTSGDIIPSLILEKTENNQKCVYVRPATDTVKIHRILAAYSTPQNWEGCKPLNVSFNNTSINANQNKWIINSDTLLEKNPTYIFEDDGYFDITLITTDTNNCSDTLLRSNSIHVFQIDAHFDVDTNKGCSPFEIQFIQNASSESFINRYKWNFGNGDTSNNPLAEFSKTTYSNHAPKKFYPSFTIWDENGCTDQLIDTIQLNIYPDVNFTVNKTILCPNESINFENTSLESIFNEFIWDISEGYTDTSHTIDTVFKIPGYHDISLTAINDSGCAKTKTIEEMIFIHDYPPLIVSNGIEIENGQSAFLKAEGGESYEWNNPSLMDNNTSNEPRVFPNQTTNFIVTATNETGCKKSDSVSVVVINPDTTTLQVPSAFSPNGDGINDILYVVSFELERFLYLRIFNKWGQKVYETRTTEQGWDGFYQGVPQDMGVYTYIAVGENELGEEIKKKGQFLLIR